MKWYNKDKTKCLDIDSVSFWQYTSVDQQKEKWETYSDYLKKMFPLRSILLVVTSGSQIELFSAEADEIYNILRNQKTVLHS